MIFFGFSYKSIVVFLFLILIYGSYSYNITTNVNANIINASIINSIETISAQAAVLSTVMNIINTNYDSSLSTKHSFMQSFNSILLNFKNACLSSIIDIQLLHFRALKSPHKKKNLPRRQGSIWDPIPQGNYRICFLSVTPELKATVNIVDSDSIDLQLGLSIWRFFWSRRLK